MLNLALLTGMIIALLALAAGCVPAGTGTAAGGDTSSLISMVVFLLGLFVVFYFLMIRPQKNARSSMRH